MNPRVREGITYLAREFSVDRPEFQHHFRDGSEMLLVGLLSGGYAWEGNGRIQLTEQGHRALGDMQA